jgi:hypothetical protein
MLVSFQSHMWLLGIIFTFSSHTLYFNQQFSIVYYFFNIFLEYSLCVFLFCLEGCHVLLHGMVLFLTVC